MSTNNNYSIIVEDLDASINVTVLTRHFSSAGSVAKVDISRPTRTAIVTFKANTTADFAVANLNGSTILGRPCRVSHIPEGAHPVDPVAKPVGVVGKPVAKLVTKPVVPEVPVLVQQQVSFNPQEAEQMRAAGMMDAGGSVRITPEVMAAMVPDGQAGVVESTNPVTEKAEAAVSVENPASKSLYIRNISTDTTEDALRAMFARYGPIVGVRLKMSKYVRGGVYVIVKYEDAQHAAQAVAALNGWKQESGEPLMVKFNLPRSVRRRMMPKRVVAPRRRLNVPLVERVPVEVLSDEKPATKTVYIRNVPSNMTEDALRGMFASAGAVIDVRLKQSKRVPGRMYAFVKYEAAQHAAQAVADLNGMQQESGDPLTVKLNVRRRTKAKRRVAREAAVGGGSSDEKKSQVPESSSASAKANTVMEFLSGAEVCGSREGSTQPELKAAILVEAMASPDVGKTHEVLAA
jgi:RNA recognition motif-containing protein